MSPRRLSRMILAVSSSAPLLSSIFPRRTSYSSFTPDNNACKVSYWVLPPSCAVSTARCSSSSFSRAVETCSSVSVTPINFPLVSKAETPRVSIASEDLPDAPIRFIRTLFKEFPASEPLIPLFASTPKRVALSSRETLKFLKEPPAIT